jgi:hypothetical protein
LIHLFGQGAFLDTPKFIQKLVKSLTEKREDYHNNEKSSNVFSRRGELGILIVLGTLLSLIYYFPILNSGNNLGIQDWDINFAWTEVTRISLLVFHQFPLWNPFKCGGSPLFVNPQIPVVSFQTLFALLFGTIRGIKLYIFFQGTVGFIGFYLLARQYKLSYVGSLLASIIFSFSGITGSFISTGTIVFATFAYTPFTLFCLNKSIQKRKWGIIAGILYALSFYAGYHIPLILGVYIFIYIFVLSFIERSFAPFKAFMVMALTTTLLILPKLLFSIQLLRIYPRIFADTSGFSIQNFFYFLLSQKQNLFNEMDVQKFYFQIDENSLYIGIIAFAFFLLFFIKNRKGVRQNISLIISMFIIFWIMLGNGIHPSIYAAIRYLPVFNSFRVAQRFRFDFIIPLALIIGLGLDNIVRLFQMNKLVRYLSILCLVIIYVDLTIFSSTNFLSKTLIIVNPESHLSRNMSFVQTEGNTPDFEIQRTIQLPAGFQDFQPKSTFIPWSFEYLKIIQNEGVLKCYNEGGSRVYALAADDKNYQGEYHLLEPDKNIKLENIFWSPNKLTFKITYTGKTVNNSLIVNQNFYPGWISIKDAGPCERAKASSGLLATTLNSSSELVTLEFNPLKYYTICK